MSGHSKWSTIKHKKGKADAKKGKVFTKLIKEITIAARMGGGNVDNNPRLRLAIDNAKAENMPRDNIERAVKKGTGDLEGVNYEESSYEGYGPAGVAILIDVLTDNRNRTTANIRHTLHKYNGSMGESGCVSWMFNKKGLIQFDAEGVSEDDLIEIALDAGADDIVQQEDIFEVFTAPENFNDVKEAFDQKEFKYLSAEIAMIPQNTVKLEKRDAEKVLNLLDKLEEDEDVQDVYSNIEIDQEVLDSIE